VKVCVSVCTRPISKNVGNTLKVMLFKTKLMLRVPRSMLRDSAPVRVCVCVCVWNCVGCDVFGYLYVLEGVCL
jgi:hypothetical protein